MKTHTTTKGQAKVSRVTLLTTTLDRPPHKTQKAGPFPRGHHCYQLPGDPSRRQVILSEALSSPFFNQQFGEQIQRLSSIHTASSDPLTVKSLRPPQRGTACYIATCKPQAHSGVTAPCPRAVTCHASALRPGWPVSSGGIAAGSMQLW